MHEPEKIREQISGTPARGPAYRIHTRRLVLRCFDPKDAPLLIAAMTASIDHLRPWFLWAKYEPEDLQTKIERLRRLRGEFDLGKDFTYGIFNVEETQVLGSSGLHTRAGPGAREIAYWIHKDHLGQGLATEAAAALAKVAFVVDKVERVEMLCAPVNVRSIAIPRKLGFYQEATLRHRTHTPDGRPRDTVVWTMLAEEFPASPVAAADIKAFDAVGRRLV